MITATVTAIISPMVQNGGAPPGPTAVVLDTFTEVSDTNIASHTPDIDTVGTGYEGYTAPFTVIAAQGELAGSIAPDNGARIDAGIADCLITVTYSNIVDNAIFKGATFRNTVVTGPSDDASWRIAHDNDRLFLFQGSSIRDSITGQDFTDDTELVVTLDGDDIQGTIGGQTVSFTSATNNTVTYHGPFVEDDAAGNRITEFKIEALP